jgi:hypothetical protein
MDRARARGLDRDGDAGELTDELLAAVIAEARASRPNGKSEDGKQWLAQHDQIKAWLDAGLPVTNVHALWAAAVWWCHLGHFIGTRQRNWDSGSARRRCAWPTVSSARENRVHIGKVGACCSRRPTPYSQVIGVTHLVWQRVEFQDTSLHAHGYLLYPSSVPS